MEHEELNIFVRKTNHRWKQHLKIQPKSTFNKRQMHWQCKTQPCIKMHISKDWMLNALKFAVVVNKKLTKNTQSHNDCKSIVLTQNNTSRGWLIIKYKCTQGLYNYCKLNSWVYFMNNHRINNVKYLNMR